MVYVKISHQFLAPMLTGESSSSSADDDAEGCDAARSIASLVLAVAEKEEAGEDGECVGESVRKSLGCISDNWLYARTIDLDR